MARPGLPAAGTPRNPALPLGGPAVITAGWSIRPGQEHPRERDDRQPERSSSRQMSKFDWAHKLMTITKFVIVISWVG
jgi:hypothetical protein